MVKIKKLESRKAKSDINWDRGSMLYTSYSLMYVPNASKQSISSYSPMYINTDLCKILVHVNYDLSSKGGKS